MPMKKVHDCFIGFFLLAALAGCSAAGAQTILATATPTATPRPQSTGPAAAAGCPDAMAVIKSLYDADSAGQFDTSLALFSDDATFASWSQGVNGHHMIEKHLTGKQQIRTVLGNPGLVRSSGTPNAPVFQQSEVTTSGNQVTFMLRPDRLRTNGKPYNPYQVQVIFEGCKIKSLTVIEMITWL